MGDFMGGGLAGRLAAMMQGRKPNLSGMNTGISGGMSTGQGPINQGPINQGGFIAPMVGAGLPPGTNANPFGAKTSFGKAMMPQGIRRPAMSGPPRRQGPRRFRTF